MPNDTIILRRARPWTLDSAGNRVRLPAEWFFFICDRTGEFAPASVAHNVSRAALIEEMSRDPHAG
jgi:hypothetical protein